jgi:hypothetical protein
VGPRALGLLALTAACGGGPRDATAAGGPDASRPRPDAARPDAARPDARPGAHRPKQALDPSDRLPPFRRYADVVTAMLDLIPPQTRVLGLGELHVRSDRTPARSALSVFTDEVMPAIADRVSDLVLETWIVDKKCQAKGAAASKRIEQAMKRPAETQRELGTGIGRVSGAGVKVHALRMGQWMQTEVAVAVATLSTRLTGGQNFAGGAGSTRRGAATRAVVLARVAASRHSQSLASDHRRRCAARS